MYLSDHGSILANKIEQKVCTKKEAMTGQYELHCLG